MRRIVILGSGGAGKSTLARRLGALLELPVVHLDALFWKAGWIETPRDERLPLLEQVVRSDAWILDGNWAGTGLSLRLAAADTVLFLDLPRTLCLYRVVSRWLAFRGRTRPDLPEDCPERLDPEFARWIWEFPYRHRPRLLRAIAAHRDGRRVVRLQSTSTVSAFLDAVRAEIGSLPPSLRAGELRTDRSTPEREPAPAETSTNPANVIPPLSETGSDTPRGR